MPQTENKNGDTRRSLRSPVSPNFYVDFVRPLQYNEQERRGVDMDDKQIGQIDFDELMDEIRL